MTEYFRTIMSKENSVEIPLEIQEKADRINEEWLSRTQVVVEPYSLGQSAIRIRYRLINKKTKETYLELLDPATADGHTYNLIGNAVDERYRAGIREGKRLAVAAFLKNACELIGIKPSEV